MNIFKTGNYFRQLLRRLQWIRYSINTFKVYHKIYILYYISMAISITFILDTDLCMLFSDNSSR